LAESYLEEDDDFLPLGQQVATDAVSLDLDRDIANVLSTGPSAASTNANNVSNSAANVASNALGAPAGEQEVLNAYLADIAPVGRTGQPVNPAISQIVNSVFRTRISDSKREEKLQLFEIPENCCGLDKVRTNQSMWDKITPRTRTMDSKLQNLQNMIVAAGAGICKALSILTQALSTGLEKSAIDSLLKDLLNVQVLVGQSNVDLNVRRRELFKPDLNDQYHPLCSPSVPFTEWLFGDALTTQVKEITDINRVCGRLFQNQSSGRGRGRPSRGFRGRGNQRFQPYYGRGRGSFHHRRPANRPFLGQSSTQSKKKE
jgi:hypothetical protein